MPAVQPARATARQIRRAFGPQAADAVNSHADAIEELNKQVAFITAVLARPLVGRLRWLLFGT